MQMIAGSEVFLGLLSNLVVLILLVAVYGTLLSRIENLSAVKKRLVLGVMFGLFAISSM